MTSVRDFWDWTLLDFQRAFRTGELHPMDLSTAFVQQWEATEPRVKAYLYFEPETILKTARSLSQPSDESSPLWGIPVAIKDIICTRGIRTTCASRILENFIPPYDATAVARLKERHALLFGKTNLDEFAMGSSTENSAFHPTYNPWDPERVPGGSSGGSAAAVAAGMPFWALGSDTGGSVRQPASLCGVVGMKPTYGRVSRYGLIAFASSLDVIGVFSRRVLDNAVLLHAIAGHDPHDQTSADVPVFDLESVKLPQKLRGWRIGIPREFFAEGLDASTRAVIEAALHRLEQEGAQLVEIRLPHAEYAIATYYVICTAEASSNLARYDGVRYTTRKPSASFREMYARTRQAGFGPEVKRRIMLGTFALSAGYYDAYYLTGARARRSIAEDFQQAFAQVDVIAGPTSPTTAWRLGEKVDDPLAMYLSDIYTVPASLAGLPGLSVPVGLDDQGLPVGLQLVAPHFCEDRLYQLGLVVETLIPFYREYPGGIPA